MGPWFGCTVKLKCALCLPIHCTIGNKQIPAIPSSTGELSLSEEIYWSEKAHCSARLQATNTERIKTGLYQNMLPEEDDFRNRDSKLGHLHQVVHLFFGPHVDHLVRMNERINAATSRAVGLAQLLSVCQVIMRPWVCILPAHTYYISCNVSLKGPSQRCLI